MLDPVLQELVQHQRDIARFRGHDLFLVSDEEIAAGLMDFYGQCLACGEPIPFKPKIAVALCEDAEHFIHLYGLALERHWHDHPDCEKKAMASLTPEDWRQAEEHCSKFTEEDYRRWEGR
jgi:hypothetical protein